MEITSKLSREDITRILSEIISYTRRRLYSTRTPMSEKATWNRILLGATDQFIKATTGQETDGDSLAELLEKLPKRVLKRIEREVGFETGIRRVVKAESK